MKIERALLIIFLFVIIGLAVIIVCSRPRKTQVEPELGPILEIEAVDLDLGYLGQASILNIINSGDTAAHNVVYTITFEEGEVESGIVANTLEPGEVYEWYVDLNPKVWYDSMGYSYDNHVEFIRVTCDEGASRTYQL